MFKRLLGSASRPPRAAAALPENDDWANGFDAFLAERSRTERRPRSREDLLRQEFTFFVAQVVQPVVDGIRDQLETTGRSVQLEGRLEPDEGSATQYVVLVFSAGGRKEFWYRIQYQTDSDRLSISCTGIKGSDPGTHLENQFCPQLSWNADQERHELGFRRITRDQLAAGISAAYLEYKRTGRRAGSVSPAR